MQFFSSENEISDFLYKYICLIETIFKKFDCKAIKISIEIYKKLKIVEFFNMWHFIFEIEILNIAFDKRPVFVIQVLNSSVHGSLAPIFVYVRYQSEGAK